MTQLYQSLIRSSHPPTALEMKPYLDRLILVGRFEEAYQDWRATSSPAETLARYPYNGNFEAPLDGLPFNWVFDDVSGAEIQITAAPDRGNSHAMRVQFSGARVRLGACRAIADVGAGQLSSRIGSESVRSAHRERPGLANFLRRIRMVLAETNFVTGTAPWTDLRVKFSVPSSDCRAQWLKLTIPARTASETEIEGDVWFQDFRIIAEGQ